MADVFNDSDFFTLHIVLATVPQGAEGRFDDIVKRNYFNKYREDCEPFFPDKTYWNFEDTDVTVLYNPITYYMFGNYDVAYISLIDNFKFSQRVFEPQTAAEPELFFSPHTFQSFTGVTYPTGPLKKFFYENLKKTADQTRKYFTGICTLKLNNGFLIGNGKSYWDLTVKKICGQIEEINKQLLSIGEGWKQVNFLVMQSFSWFEISLLLFTDDPYQLSNIVIQLRKICIEDLGDDRLLKDSLYESLLNKNANDPSYDESKTKERLLKANVFADTQSYIGLHSDLVNNDFSHPFVKAFMDRNFQLKSNVEWQVKPGHMHLLMTLIQQNEFLKDSIFDFEKKFLLMGKRDYLLEYCNIDLNNNLKLFHAIYHNKSQLFDHVRKIRTQIYFTTPKSEAEIKDVIPFNKELSHLGVHPRLFKETDDMLKRLKISRQIRSKIIKIYSNFNNGIQDIILFPYFLDFSIFINDLQKLILKNPENEEDEDPDPSVAAFEEKLMEMISIFEEGFNIRILNCYQFEDINDFDLDFNSSIQQLLSVYSSVAAEIGNLFFIENYTYGPVVQLNLKDTVSNYNSINYYAHHLTSPEFIFATLTKEVTNFIDFDKKRLLHDLQKKYFHEVVINPEDGLLYNMNSEGLIDFRYFLNDAIRFLINYSDEFDLFYYWFWTYNLQNSSLYNRSGAFNEQHFRKEMFRFMFLMKFFNVNAEPQCPVPDLLYNYWDRNFINVKQALDRYFEILTGGENNRSDEKGIKSDFIKLLKDAVAAIFNHALTRCCPENGQPYHFNENKARLIELFGNDQPLDNKFIKNFCYRKQLFQDEPDMGLINSYGPLYLQTYMYNYLKLIFNENNKSVAALKRGEEGKPCKPEAQSPANKQFYLVDQTGGLFFLQTDHLNKYFKMSANVLVDLWNFSAIRKKEFIREMIDINEKASIQ